MADIQSKLQALNSEHQTLQETLNTSLSARQTLSAQEEENSSVAREFSTLPSDANIYKLVGPILLKQDPQDAKRTVDARLEYIRKELEGVEGRIGEGQKKAEGLRGEMGALQQELAMMEQGQEGQGQGQIEGGGSG